MASVAAQAASIITAEFPTQATISRRDERRESECADVAPHRPFRVATIRSAQVYWQNTYKQQWVAVIRLWAGKGLGILVLCADPITSDPFRMSGEPDKLVPIISPAEILECLLKA